MNWFMLSKLAFRKMADPHSEMVCPNCKQNFITDLLWERPDLNSYHIMDHDGRQMSREQHREDAARAKYEASIENMSCPHCGTKHRIEFRRNTGRHAPEHTFLPSDEEISPSAFKEREPLVFPI